MPVVVAALDHLVVAAATLEQGEDHLERLLGVRPQRGGKHVAMATHNSLLRLGDKAYLEVIAIDPTASPPQRPRWFALDSAAMREALAEAPRLIHWVARTDDIDAARRVCAIDPGPAQSMERGPISISPAHGFMRAAHRSCTSSADARKATSRPA